jgi:hypothetical protein
MNLANKLGRTFQPGGISFIQANIRMESPVRGKHSGLLGTFISYEEFFCCEYSPSGRNLQVFPIS